MPQPGPDAMHRNRGLPVPVVVLGYLTLCLLPLILAGTRAVPPTVAWELAAAGAGLAGLAAMAVQFVTSGRFQVVSGRLGIDHVMAFHKTAAGWVLLALILHPVVYVVPTWQADPALAWERLVAYHTLPHYRTGVIALAALVVLVITSALRTRLHLKYEVWRAIHLILATVAVGAGLHHAVTVGRFSAEGLVEGYWWLAGAAVAAVLVKLYGVRWWRLRARPWRLDSVTNHAGRMWELDFQPAPGTPPLPYRAGQFVWMTVGRRRFPLFDHPFSIADSPLRPGVGVIIKEAGDFTDTIGTLPPGAAIGLDGPYGNFTMEGQEDRAVLLIGGGVGIAPILGLLRDLKARGHPHPVRLAYAAGAPENFACLDEIAAAEAGLDLQTLLISETPGDGWRGQVGRLDRARLERMLAGLDPENTVAMICGPGPMVTAVADTLLDLGLPMDRVRYERFDYAEGASRLDKRLKRRFFAMGAGLAVGVGAFVWALAFA